MPNNILDDIAAEVDQDQVQNFPSSLNPTPPGTGIDWEATLAEPGESINGDMDNDIPPSFVDYMKMIPALAITGMDLPRSKLEEAFVTPQDRVNAAAQGEQIRDGVKQAIGSYIKHNPQITMFPGTTAERFAEDYFTEGTRMVSSLIEASGSVLETVGLENQMDDLGAALAEMGMNPLDVFREQGEDFGQEHFGDELNQGIASTLGFVAAGMKARALNLSKKAIGAVVATLGASVGSQAGRLEAESFAATPEEIKMAYYLNGAVGTSEAIPIMGIFRRLDKATGGAFSKKIKSKVAKVGIEGIKGALQEAFQEGGQTIGSNVIASDMVGFDPTRDWNENLGTAMEVGGSVGFLMNALAVSSGFRTRVRNVKKIEKEFEEETLRLTGAESMDQLAFRDDVIEGKEILFISTLPDEYIRAQKRLAGSFTALEEAGAAVPENAAGTIAEDQLAAARAAIAVESPLADTSEINAEVLAGAEDVTARTSRQFGPNAEGPGAPVFFSSDEVGFVTNKEVTVNRNGVPTVSRSLFDVAPTENIVMAATRNIERDQAVWRLGNEVLQRDRAELLKIKAGDITVTEDGRPQADLEADIFSLQQQQAVTQARVTEAKSLAAAIERELSKALKSFPDRSIKFLVEDYLNTVKTLPGNIAYEGSTGAAPIFTLRSDKGEIKLHGIHINLEPAVVAAARLKEAKQRGVSDSELASRKADLARERNVIYEGLYHELGHHYGFKFWSKLHAKVLDGTANEKDKAMWRALQADYVRYVTESLRSPIKRFLFSRNNRNYAAAFAESYIGAGNIHDFVEGDFSSLPQMAQDILNKRQMLEVVEQGQLGYMLSFDEYVAEEMSKAATLGKAPGTRTIDPFFREGVRGMRKIIAKRPGETKLTSEAMGRFFQIHSEVGRLKAAIEKIKESGADALNPVRAMHEEMSVILSPTTARERIEEIDKFNWFMDVGFNILQIAEQHPHIQGLQDYVEAISEWKNEVNGHLRDAEKTLITWKQLGKKEMELLGRILLEESAGITFDGKTLTEPRDFTQAEIAKYGLSEKALELRTQIKADFRKSLEEMEGVLKRKTLDMFVDEPAKQVAELKKITKEFARLKAKPYFPFMRFGKYIMEVRSKGSNRINGSQYNDGDIVDFQAFDTKTQRAKEVRKVKLSGNKVTVGESKMKTPNFSLQGMPLTMVEHLERSMKGSLTKEQQKMFDQVKQDILPFKSFRKQFTRRRNVKGYSLDAARSYANYMTSFANHIGRVKYDSAFQAALKSVEDSISVMKRLEINSDRRVEILDHMNDHMEYVLNPVSEWTSVRAAAFFWFLGFNVKSAFVNSTQIPLVTYPYLAARFGDARAVAALGRANGTAVKSFTAPSSVDPDIMKMIEQGLSESWLDESLATELALAASERNLEKSLPRKGYQTALTKISHYGSLPFHTVEKFNRHVAAIAAYRLATAKGLSHKKAVLEARRCVRKTQFEYARWARPKFMRGKVGGTLFVFMNYMQNALYFALGGDPGAMRMNFVLLAMAGLGGLPFGEDIMDLVDGMSTFAKRRLGMKNPHTDVRTEIRKIVTELDMDPDLVMHGLSSSTFGLANIGEFMGWPIPDVDLSASLSMGRIIPGASMARPVERTFDRAISETTEGVGGAAISGGLGLVKPLFDNNPDTWKKWEKAMPAAMRNISKAARIKTSGVEATRGGWPIAALDWQDHQERAELTLQGLGFTPRSISRGWEGYIAAQSAITYYEAWKANILRDWNHHRTNNDEEGVKTANAEIRAYNRMVPFPEMKIGGEARMQSYESYRRNHLFNENQIEQSKYVRRLSDSILSVYQDADKLDDTVESP